MVDGARGSDRVVVGPFMGEVGFEVLYWIPAVRKRLEGVDPRRVLIVSRGGVQEWYDLPGSDYRDILSAMTPEEFGKLVYLRMERSKGSRRRRTTQKQLEPDDIDRHVLRSLGLDDEPAEWLHPEWIYKELAATRSKPLDIERILTPPKLDPAPTNDTTVVKFYARPSFPMNADNRRFVDRLVSKLRERGPVIGLGSPKGVDEHQDFPMPHNVPVYHPQTGDMNLAEQTSFIKQAGKFVGTYGGFSYIALSYGIPTVAYYSDRQHFFERHLQIAKRRAARGKLEFEVCSV